MRAGPSGVLGSLHPPARFRQGNHLVRVQFHELTFIGFQPGLERLMQSRLLAHFLRLIAATNEAARSLKPANKSHIHAF